MKIEGKEYRTIWFKNNIVKINENGSIILNQKFFKLLNDKKIYNNHFDNLFDNLSKETKLNES